MLFVLLSQAACHRPSVDQSLVGTWRRTVTLESEEWFIDYSYFADHTFSFTGKPKIMTQSFKEEVGEIAPTTGTWRLEENEVVLQVRSDAGKSVERMMKWRIMRVEERKLIVNDSTETMSLERIK